MKKSQVVRRLTRLLKTWENSMLTDKTSREIIDLLTSKNIGMLPPHSLQADLGCECGCKGRCPRGHAWDSEHLPINANQVKRIYR